jgi:DNA-binding CsgD family transcriptional regulator
VRAVVAIRHSSYLRKVVCVRDLRESDLHGALEVVAAANEGRAQDPLPFGPAVLESLRRLISADQLEYAEYTWANGFDVVAVDLPAESDPYDAATVDAILATCHTYLLAERRHAKSRMPLKLSDFATQQELRRNPFHIFVSMAKGRRHELKLWIPAPDRVSYGFYLGRSRHDFTERDRAVLALLRPHLAAARRRWARLRQPSLLTSRETEVLTLVARGLTNREIARHLVVSPGTVRTHLENVFEKLGVHTRTGAVAAAFGSRAA